MSKIDGLLRLAATQNADELVVREDQPPALRVAGVLRRLSMPVCDAAFVRELIAEALGDRGARPDGDERCVLSSGPVRVRWKTGERIEATFTRVRAEVPIEPPPPPPAFVRADRPSPAPAPIMTTANLEAPVGLSRLARLCFAAIDAGASDLVLADGRAAAMKLHGAMVRGEEALGEGEVMALMKPYLDDAHRSTLDRKGNVDLAIALQRENRDGGRPVRFRCSLFRALAGASAVLRPIRDRAPTLTELRLPEEIARFAELHEGLVLFTGAAGSGKSTSLVAMVEHLSRARAAHVVTLEDPIEYVFEGARAVIHQREIGAHVASFAEGLRAALRESPDVILLGEMRDAETIAAAVTAAETGHLVLSTLHAGSATSAIERIVDAFPEHAQRNARGRVADVLRGVVTQRLLPARDGGRVPALEIVPVNAAVASLVREGKAYQLPGVLQTGRDAGMVPMARAIAEWVRAGVVSREVAMVHAPDPQHLMAQLGR
jgi:twitching motility protein PilT